MDLSLLCCFLFARLAVPEGTTWRAVFLLSNTCKEALAEEAEMYGDLEFLDVPETYYALTPKVCNNL